MIGLVLAAATLSLTSTNDYVITKSLMPTCGVEIVGVGMGTRGGSNCIFRAEDALFLREAFAERYIALRNPFSVPDMMEARGIPLARSFNVSTVANPGDSSTLEYYAPESFDSPYWYMARGVNNSFVDRSFDLVPGVIGCSTNFTFVIAGLYYPTQDCASSYLPYMRGYNRITFDSSFTNQRARGAFVTGIVRKGYSVVEKLGNVIATAPVSTFERRGTYRGTSFYRRNRSIWNPVFNTRSKTYTRTDGTTVVFNYTTDVRSLDLETVEDSTEMDDIYPLIKKARYAEVVVGVPYYAISDVYFTPYASQGTLNVTVAGASYHCHKYEDHIENGTYGPNLAKLNLVTNRYDATILKTYLIGGFRYKMTVKKSIDNGLGTGSSTNITSRNDCCVVVRSTPRFWRYNIGGYPAYEMATTVKQMLADAETYLAPDWNEGVFPNDYVPDARSFPDTITRNHPVVSGTIEGTHRHEHELTCEWLRVLFVFERAFRATFTE